MDVFLIKPEDVGGMDVLAMIQALYSRSMDSARLHAEMAQKRGSKKFLRTYYVGYGHKSIGDCAGGPALFFEGVSMLAAKAIQDTPLFSGQETSTRYLDFTGTGRLGKPIRTLPANQQLLSRQLQQFYATHLDKVRNHIITINGIDERNKKEAKAAKVAAFDVMRGFLPVSSSTQTSLTLNARQFCDHLQLLLGHPLAEVRGLAFRGYRILMTEWEDLFSDTTYPGSYSYIHCPPNLEPGLINHMVRNNVDLTGYGSRIEVPHQYRDIEYIDVLNECDFASFRDIQRNRGITTVMPLLTDELGMHDWYIDSLPDEVQEEWDAVETVWAENRDQIIESSQLTPEEAQYTLPMGYKVRFTQSGNVKGWAYFLQQRSGQRVHPTVRNMVQETARWISESYIQTNIDMNIVDMSESRFTTKRAFDDIVRREP